jgi:hypothetical protein
VPEAAQPVLFFRDGSRAISGLRAGFHRRGVELYRFDELRVLIGIVFGPGKTTPVMPLRRL